MTRPPASVVLADWHDPEAVFLALFSDAEDAFWLDAGPDAVTGWSWVGAGVRERDVDAVAAVRCDESPPADTRSGRFRGGWVGWLGYELGAERAGAPTAGAADEVPPQLWLRAERFVAFDHENRVVFAFAPHDEVVDFARTVEDSAQHPIPPEDRAVDVDVSVVARHAPDEYAALIERCRDAIREGDAYQLCLTTRFSIDTAPHPVEVYRRLRRRTPAHHGGFVRSGPFALLSASPELFLEVVQGTVRTHPIKGTRPRGTDAASDASLAAELVASEKERAENVMIVDLMRNDLSRVCEPGTIAVDRLFDVESYPAVHQLVSAVSGTLRAGTTSGDLLDAAFPAGSMTGAPKLSAMTILNALEGGPRGVFSGCFGWVGEDGALDLAMVIRSIVVHPGGAYVGAGGGITWRSEAAAEVAEVGVKARGPLAALGAQLPPGW